MSYPRKVLQNSTGTVRARFRDSISNDIIPSATVTCDIKFNGVVIKDNLSMTWDANGLLFKGDTALGVYAGVLTTSETANLGLYTVIVTCVKDSNQVVETFEYTVVDRLEE